MIDDVSSDSDGEGGDDDKNDGDDESGEDSDQGVNGKHKR